MGAAGLAAGIVLVLAAAVLLVLGVLGLALLVLGAVANHRRGSRPLIWTGASLLALVGVIVVAVLGWVWINADPKTLELDLRQPVSASSLDKDDMPGFPGAYEYDSDRVELVLPDGTEFASDADSIVVWTDDGVVTSIKISRRTAPRERAVEIAQAWADDLGLGTPGLDAASDESWSTRTLAHDAVVRVALTPVADARAMPSLSIDVSRTAGAP